MTALNLPVSDPRFDRYTLRGELCERPKQYRGRMESIALTRVVVALRRWLDTCPEPRGEAVLDLGFVLCENPLTAVDIAAGLIAAEVADESDTEWVRGRPELAAEFINHREPAEAVWERVGAYIECGVPEVWVIDPFPGKRWLDIVRPGRETLRLHESVSFGSARLPGFSCPVADLFR